MRVSLVTWGQGGHVGTGRTRGDWGDTTKLTVAFRTQTRVEIKNVLRILTLMSFILAVTNFALL